MAQAPSQETPDRRRALRLARLGLSLVWATNRRLTLIMAGLTVLAALLPAVGAFVGKLIVDGVISAAQSGLADDRWTVLGWVGLEAAVLMTLHGAQRFLRLCKSLLYAELGYTVSRRIFEKSLTLDLTQFEDPAIQEQLILARRDATSRPFNLVNKLFEFFQHTIALLAVIGVIWTFSPLAVLIIIVGGLPLFIVELKFSGRVFRFYQGRTPEIRERSYLEQLLTKDTHAKELLHYQAGPQLMDRYSALFQHLYGADRQLQVRRSVSGAALNMVSQATFFAAKVWIVLETVAAAITLGDMTMYLALFRQGQRSVTALLASLGGMWEDLLYVSNLDAFLNVPLLRRTGTATEGTRADDGIRLEHVSFTYPGNAGPAVDDVSLHLPSGTRLGLVGVNGSGKTTLVKLMIGLYRPDVGRVLLDGRDLEEWDLDAVRRRIGVMFQPFARYKMTVGENIAFGEGLRIDDEERLLEAARAGMADELVASLPERLDTRLTRRFRDGRELSGGQWQRLALARAFLRKSADILILDEPTSAMDAAAEADFFEAFGSRGAEHTTVLISHRLSNIKKADQIVVLDEGAVVERGSHDELMRHAGIYRDLFRTQAEPYVEPTQAPTQ